MNKFVIQCPKCDNKFNMTKFGKDNFKWFNEIEVVDYDDRTKLTCPKCSYYETDKEG